METFEVLNSLGHPWDGSPGALKGPLDGLCKISLKTPSGGQSQQMKNVRLEV